MDVWNGIKKQHSWNLWHGTHWLVIIPNFSHEKVASKLILKLDANVVNSMRPCFRGVVGKIKDGRM